MSWHVHERRMDPQLCQIASATRQPESTAKSFAAVRSIQLSSTNHNVGQAFGITLVEYEQWFQRTNHLQLDVSFIESWHVHGCNIFCPIHVHPHADR